QESTGEPEAAPPESTPAPSGDADESKSKPKTEGGEMATDGERSTLFPPLEETQQMREKVDSGTLRQDVGLPTPDGGETKILAIVRDGESWYFDGLVEEFIYQLEELAVGNYGLEVYEANAEYDPDVVRELLGQALENPSVDLIYAAGIVATEVAASMPDEDRRVPIMAGAVRFSDLAGLRISAEGTSAIPNLTFITNPQRVSEDLRMLRDLTRTKKIHGLIDAYALSSISALEKAKSEAEKALGVSLDVVGTKMTAKETLAAIPNDVTDAYVTILPSLDIFEREDLLLGLAERKIRTISMLGASDVEIGALAALAPDNSEAVARRTAVNAHQLLQGVSTELLPVYLPVEDNLVINLETADTVDWSPDYETVLTAQFVNEDRGEKGDGIDVAKAMSKAASRNAEVRTTAEDETIAQQDVYITRSNRRPQVTIEGNHSRQDLADSYVDAPGASFGASPTSSSNRSFQGEYGVQVRKVLFNDEIRSGMKAGKESVIASRLDTRSVQLDAMEDAAIAYFNYLSTNDLYEIEKENLRLTENNLQLAKLRIEIGSAEPSERFRWEQDVARSRAQLFQRDSDRADALVEFNRILGEPRGKKWDFEDYEVADDEFFFMDDDISPLIENIRDFEKFSAFLQSLAVFNSPELRSFEHSLAAQGILLDQNRRSFVLPEISGFVSQNRTVLGANTLDDYLSQHESLVGFQFSIPLFEGGRRTAEVERQRSIIRQLAAQRENALELIEQRTYAAVHGISAAHPNIRFSRQGLEASEKTYESIQEKYSQGAASILDLLDAQSALLGQRQEAAIATYSYLQQIHRLQRAIAWFEYEKSASEKREWTEALKTYLDDGNLENFEFSPGVSVPSSPDWEAAIIASKSKTKSRKNKKSKSRDEGTSSAGDTVSEDVELGETGFEFVEYEIIDASDTSEESSDANENTEAVTNNAEIGSSAEDTPPSETPERGRRSKLGPRNSLAMEDDLDLEPVEFSESFSRVRSMFGRSAEKTPIETSVPQNHSPVEPVEPSPIAEVEVVSTPPATEVTFDAISMPAATPTKKQHRRIGGLVRRRR
ncbi:MAG: TolC family protein, partial [Verrucomicrobiota bacterium]